ncbi:MAG TPA: chloride channel protein [Rhodospirillaceae bacterium]|nr:chloride channel protein [Rhodospirillaceae bacterium]
MPSLFTPVSHCPHCLSRRIWLPRILFWGGAISIGLLGALFAVGSTKANAFVQHVLALFPWAPVLLLPLGLGASVFLAKTIFKGTQGSGIPQVIASLHASDRAEARHLLSVRIAFGKMFLTLLGLSCGASIGREGPTVQVGASIMHALGKHLHIPGRHIHRSLILAGGAAGIAAAFNTPLAGIVFAIEELSHSFEERTSGTTLTAVILAGLVSLTILGTYTYFGQYEVAFSFGMATAILVLSAGVFGGLMGGIFSRILIQAGRKLPGFLQPFRSGKPVLFAMACGVLLAVFALLSGNTTLGTGYEEARMMLEGHDGFSPFYGLLKMLATIVSYLSGIPGGIFAPSLAVGAGIGNNLAHFLPSLPVSLVVIMGMVGYFSGVVQAPITAAVIVMEMTSDQEIILPLLATSLIACGVSRMICPHPLYRTLAEDFLNRQE